MNTGQSEFSLLCCCTTKCVTTISATFIKNVVFIYMSMNVCILYRKYRPRKQPLRVSSTVNAAKVEKWQRVLVFSFMSSEESVEDESENPSHRLC